MTTVKKKGKGKGKSAKTRTVRVEVTFVVEATVDATITDDAMCRVAERVVDAINDDEFPKRFIDSRAVVFDGAMSCDAKVIP